MSILIKNGRIITASDDYQAGLIALFAGVIVALVGYWVPALNFLYALSWFTGFLISFVLYYVLMPKENILRE